MQKYIECGREYFRMFYLNCVKDLMPGRYDSIRQLLSDTNYITSHPKDYKQLYIKKIL